MIFVVAVLGELGGTYAIWLASHRLAAVSRTRGSGRPVRLRGRPDPATRGPLRRLFAAYAGVFLIGAMLWGWGVDGKEPDRFDWIGVTIVLFGVIVILAGRRLFE